MQQIVEFQENIEMVEFNSKLDKAIIELGFLNEIKEPYLIIENQQAYETLFFIRKLIKSKLFKRKPKNWTLFLNDSNTTNIFSSMLSYLADISFEFNCENVRVAKIKQNVDTSLNERRISILDYLLDILIEMVNSENEFSIKFLNDFLKLNNGLESLLLFFEQEKFQPIIFEIKTKVKHFNVNQFMKNLINLLASLSDLDDLDKGKWISLNVAEKLKGYALKLNNGNEPIDSELAAKYEKINRNVNSKTVYEILGYLKELKYNDFHIGKQHATNVFHNDIQIIHRHLFKKSFNNVRLYLDSNFDNFLVILFKFLNLNITKQFTNLSKSNSLDEIICSASEINMNRAFESIDQKCNDTNNPLPKKSTRTHLDRSIKLLNACLIIFNRLVNKSFEFVYRFMKGKDGHLALLGFFNNDYLIRYLNEQHATVVNYLLMNLNYLSKFLIENQPIWSNETTANYSNTIIENLLKFRLVCSLSTYKNELNKRNFIDQINSIIANQSNDKQIDNLAEKKFNRIDSIVYSDNNLINMLLEDVKAILDNIKSKKNILVIRRKFLLDLCITESINDENVKEYNLIYDKPTNWYLINKLINLYRLSLNMKAKLLLNEASPVFKEIFYFGNDCEKTYSLQILMQLCFHSDRMCKTILANDKEFIRCLQSTVDQNMLFKKDLRFICEQAIWLASNSNSIYFLPLTNAYGNSFQYLNHQHHQPHPHHKQIIESRLTSLSPLNFNGQVSSSSAVSTALHLHRHVMISYHKRNKEICSKIRDQLVGSGFNVWLDSCLNDERTFINMLNMTKAIDKSYCILVFINEFYRQSINCQLEARYMLKANKRITLVYLDSSYESTIDASNWLNQLIKDKCSLKLNSLEMDKFFMQLNSNLLNSNLSQLKAKSELIRSKPKLYKELITMRVSKIEDWSEQQVSVWFMEAKISPEIRKAFSKCNGAILKQLYKIRCETPEIFYQLLLTETKDKITLKEIAQFYFNLEELFR